jgi:hypothetical protein
MITKVDNSDDDDDTTKLMIISSRESRLLPPRQSCVPPLYVDTFTVVKVSVTFLFQLRFQSDLRIMITTTLFFRYKPRLVSEKKFIFEKNRLNKGVRLHKGVRLNKGLGKILAATKGLQAAAT